MTDRELDTRVTVEVMGLCDGERRYLTDQELIERRRAEIIEEWKTDYGMDPPAIYLEINERYTDHGDYSPKKCTKCEGPPHPKVKFYSTDIAAAWEVWEHMKADLDRWLKFVRALPSCTDGVHPHGPLVPDIWQLSPKVICLAALKTVKVKV